MILVIGKHGQLAQAFKDQVSTKLKPIEFLDHNECDLSSPEQISSVIKHKKPSIVINCGAYTNVEKAEVEPETCYEINEKGVEALAIACSEESSTLIHFSTDYVFSGQKNSAYEEGDETSPLNVYGKSKILGEKAILRIANQQNLNGAIFRTSWLYYETGHNFLRTMLKLSQTQDQLQVVSDQIGTPTYCGDLSRWVLESLPTLKSRPMDLFHLSHLGQTSWFGFAEYIFELSKNPIALLPVTTQDFPTKAKRPSFSVLDKSKFQQTFPHIPLSQWQLGVKRCLKKLSL